MNYSLSDFFTEIRTNNQSMEITLGNKKCYSFATNEFLSYCLLLSLNEPNVNTIANDTNSIIVGSSVSKSRNSKSSNKRNALRNNESSKNKHYKHENTIENQTELNLDAEENIIDIDFNNNNNNNSNNRSYLARTGRNNTNVITANKVVETIEVSNKMNNMNNNIVMSNNNSNKQRPFTRAQKLKPNAAEIEWKELEDHERIGIIEKKLIQASEQNNTTTLTVEYLTNILLLPIANLSSNQIPVLITKIQQIGFIKNSLSMLHCFYQSIIVHYYQQTKPNCTHELIKAFRLNENDVPKLIQLYSFIDKHYNINDLPTLFHSPFFSMDLCWTQLEDCLNANTIYILEEAFERYKWFKGDYIEEYNDTNINQKGIRAKQFIHFQSQKILFNFASCGEIISESAVQDYFPYVIALEDGKYMEFTNHWAKRINHLPANKSNLYIEPNGNVYLLKAIMKSEELTFDYGIEYWLWDLTRLKWNELNTNEQKVIEIMHKKVINYKELLDQQLYRLTDEKTHNNNLRPAIHKIAEYLEINYATTLKNIIK